MRRYSVSPGTRAAAMVLIAFFCVLAAGVILLVVLSSEPLKELRRGMYHILALAVFICGLVKVYWRLKDSVVVTDEGLTYEPFSGPPRAVSWSQVVGLTPHSLRRHYDVLDDQGNCLLKLSYDLEGFSHLDAILREHLMRTSGDGRSTFFAKPEGGKILVAAGCGMLILYLLVLWFKGVNIKDLLWTFLAGSCIGWGLYFSEQRLVITREGILIEYLQRQVSISLNMIQRVSLQESYISGWMTICVDRLHQKPCKIGWIREEAPMLQQAIEAAWKQALLQQGASTSSDQPKPMTAQT